MVHIGNRSSPTLPIVRSYSHANYNLLLFIKNIQNTPQIPVFLGDLLNKGVMKIKTVYKTPKEQPKKIKPVEQSLIEKPQANKRYFWIVWEYKKPNKTNYDDHYLFRKTTYSAQNLYSKQSRELSGDYDDNPNRWKIYKRVKRIEKPLAQR